MKNEEILEMNNDHFHGSSMNNDHFHGSSMNNGKKFSVIIQNPPYAGSLHLKFLEKCIEIGEKVVSVHPATFLINTRKDGKAKTQYIPLKNKLEGHVKSCEINGMNKEFHTGLYVPFTIINIDNTKEYNEIDFECSTERKKVRSIFDCNKIGDSQLIESIINKCQKYGDMMKNHITTKDMGGNDIYYVRFMSIITTHGYNSEVDKVKTKFGTYYGTFTTPLVHKHDNQLYEHVPKTKTGNPAGCVYGTKKELENWKYFVYNNKLPIFINIVMTIDQNNNSLPYVPWLVDKKYTDDEIYKLLDINSDEQNLIDETIEKFEWHNKYYKKLCEEEID